MGMSAPAEFSGVVEGVILGQGELTLCVVVEVGEWLSHCCGAYLLQQRPRSQFDICFRRGVYAGPVVGRCSCMMVCVVSSSDWSLCYVGVSVVVCRIVVVSVPVVSGAR